jgi:hypothetical protein
MGQTKVKLVSQFEVKHKLEKLTYLEINYLSNIIAVEMDGSQAMELLLPYSCSLKVQHLEHCTYLPPNFGRWSSTP